MGQSATNLLQKFCEQRIFVSCLISQPVASIRLWVVRKLIIEFGQNLSEA